MMLAVLACDSSKATSRSVESRRGANRASKAARAATSSGDPAGEEERSQPDFARPGLHQLSALVLQKVRVLLQSVLDSLRRGLVCWFPDALSSSPPGPV